MRRVFAVTLVAAMVVVLLAVPAFAYLDGESGTKSCGGYPMELYTKVHADGGHKHKVNSAVQTYGDVGYVRSTYYYSGYSAGDWWTEGGIGYYSTSSSGGYCRYNP
ncbi:MAG: hypothetical protein ABFR95_04195 [Actinomycetota bacterium]